MIITVLYNLYRRVNFHFHFTGTPRSFDRSSGFTPFVQTFENHYIIKTVKFPLLLYHSLILAAAKISNKGIDLMENRKKDSFVILMWF